jgi:hypothetical protein
MAVALVGQSTPSTIGGNPASDVYSAYNGVPYTSTYGNTLIIVGAYNLSTFATAAPIPMMTPCDSAGNIYQPLGQLPAGATNANQARVAAWICPNARPITWASVSATTIVSAATTSVLEFSGMPPWAQLSMTTVYASTAGTSVSLSGPTNSASFCLGVAAIGTTATTITGPGGWTTENLGASPSSTNGLTTSCSFMTTSSSGTVTYAPTIGVSEAYSAMLCAITLAPVAPTQPNSNYPRFITEVQFGRNLGDLSTVPYSPGPATTVLSMPLAATLTASASYTIASTGGISLLATVIVPAAATIDLSDTAGNVYTNVGFETIPGGGVAYAYLCLDPVSVTTGNVFTFTQFTSQAALITVIAVPGVWQLDLVSPPSTGSSASPTASTGALGSQMDFEIGLVATDSGVHLTGTPTGWYSIGQYTEGTLTSDLYYRTSTPGVGFNANGGGDTISGTLSASHGWGAAIFAFKVIGYTDISQYCIAGSESEQFNSAQGREYELSQPEAGELNVHLDNHLGYFTPTNTSSPFFPGVLVEAPIRITAISNGRQYAVASGYVDQWPMSWPDLPQWGFTDVTATDTVELLTNSNLPSGLQCELRNDYPYVYLTGNENYSTTSISTSSSGGLYSTTIANECAGELAVNASLYNQRNGYYSDGGATGLSTGAGGAQVQTGLAMAYSGTQDTGFGNSNYNVNLTGSGYLQNYRGPGVTYFDPLNLPGQTAAGGNLTLEWFCQVPGVGNGTIPQYASVTLFESVSQPSNFQLINSLSISDLYIYTANLSTTQPKMQFYVQTSGGTTTQLAPYVPNHTINSNQLAPILYHCVMTMANVGASTNYAFWLNGGVNGAPNTTGTLSMTGNWTEFRLGGAKGRYGELPWLYNYTMGHFALYPYKLPAQRIQAHYQMGAGTGLPSPANVENISTYDYIAAALAYSRVPAQAAGPGYNTLPDIGQIGPMYSIDNSSTMDTINTAINSEGGTVYCDKQNNIVILGRNSTYNQPSFVTFGDNGTTQIPYLQDGTFGYDDQFVYTIAQVSQSTGNSTGVTAQAENFGGDLQGQVAYGTRAAPSVTAQVVQANDAFDQVNWRLNKYSQAHIRSKVITVDAASLAGGAIDTYYAAQGGVIGVLMSCNIGTVVSVQKNQMGAPGLSELGIIEHVSISGGPSMLKFQFIVSPYATEGDILQCDQGSGAGSPSLLGSSSLAW